MNKFNRADILIFFISFIALLFLIWLIYFNTPVKYSGDSWFLSALPGVNACFNLLSATCLLMGVRFIKAGNKVKHIQFMKGAFFFSSLFLIGYIIYHTFHGETKFLSQGLVRYTYFFILISHIILSAITLPMVLLTFYLGLSGNFERHKKIAKWTFPIWLYVSITGVIIFLMLKLIG